MMRSFAVPLRTAEAFVDRSIDRSIDRRRPWLGVPCPATRRAPCLGRFASTNGGPRAARDCHPPTPIGVDRRIHATPNFSACHVPPLAARLVWAGLRLPTAGHVQRGTATHLRPSEWIDESTPLQTSHALQRGRLPVHSIHSRIHSRIHRIQGWDVWAESVNFHDRFYNQSSCLAPTRPPGGNPAVSPDTSGD